MRRTIHLRACHRYQARLEAGGRRVPVNRTGLVGVFIVWKRGCTHAEGTVAWEADHTLL